jgi:hypothetical protein
MATKVKGFFESKINWAAIVIILTAIIPMIDGLDTTSMGIKEWVSFGIGILIVILRTYYTTTPVKKPTTKRKKT